MTIVMEMGLIHPPVGLNIFIIKNIAPDIPLGTVIMGHHSLYCPHDLRGVFTLLLPGYRYLASRPGNGSLR